VQINQTSAVSRQSFGSGVNCSGPSFNATTFALGNETLPYDPEGYVRSGNYGVQLGFSVPLDGSITEMCKDLVRRQLERERLSYELSRAVKCSELLDKGYTIRPDSDLYVLCGHIVSISAWRRTQQEASPVILQDSSVPSSSQASKPSADTPATAATEEAPAVITAVETISARGTGTSIDVPGSVNVVISFGGATSSVVSGGDCDWGFFASGSFDSSS
jgi:hypothetical protein